MINLSEQAIDPSSFRPGGALHRALAPMHNASSAYTIAYHPLCVGKRLLVRGYTQEIQVQDIDDWHVQTARITQTQAEKAALEVGAEKEVWLWATGDKVIASDTPAIGAVRFIKVENSWHRVFIFDQVVPESVSSLSQNLTEDAEIATFVAAAAMYAKYGFEKPIIWGQPTTRKQCSFKHGESTSLAIIATGANRFTWYQNDKVSRHTVNRPRLVLRSLSKQDEGSYSCLLEHQSKKSVLSASVFILIEDIHFQYSSSLHIVSKEAWNQKLNSGAEQNFTDKQLTSALEIDDFDDHFCSRILTHLARRALQRGERQTALYRASDAATRCPNNLQAQLLRGQAAASLGYLLEAKRAYEAACRLSSDDCEQQQSIQAKLIEIEAKYQAKAENVIPPQKESVPKIQRKKTNKQILDDLAVLGLSSFSEESRQHRLLKRDIRRAYLNRAKEVHPDMKGGDHDSFLAIQFAYERLLALAN